ncbi:MAG: hypothetical protein Q9220_003331 [cf. Caloplaca sp. 1 TL-2023]
MHVFLFICALSSLLNFSQAGFETLEKPFTGAQEAAWESFASANAAAQSRRSRSAASASRVSVAAHRFANATTTNGIGLLTTSAPSTSASYSSFSYTGTVAANCNASLQNSYQRMVTNIQEYTLTNGEVDTEVVGDHASYKTFTLTGPTTYTTIVTQAFRPGRPWQAWYPPNYQCCMDCYVYFPEVEVYYWPVPESEETCANGSKPLVTAQAVLPTGAARTAEAKLNTLYSNNSLTGPVTTVNADGFTFVSPSVYVAFGDVSAGDACGPVGQKYPSVTLAFAPGELQTVTALGKDHYETALGTRAFDPKNVLCPPDFKVEELFLQQDSLAGIHTYRPRIQIPSALQNLDPKWSSCIVDPYEGIDPPRQLVPASGFGDDPVATTSVAPVQGATPAAAGPSLPKNTGEGGGADPGKSSNPQIDSPSSDPIVDPGSPAQHGGSDPQPQPKPQQPDPQHPNANDPQNPNNNGNKAAQGSQGGNQDPTKPAQGDSHPVKAPQPVAIPAPAPPAVIVQGQTIKQGAAPVTIAGKPVIYSKGSVYVGNAAAAAPTGNQPIPQAQPAPKPNPVDIGGFKFTPVAQPNPPANAAKPAKAKPAVVVQGQTIQQGAPPVTINGNPVVYSGGSLQVGNAPAVPIPAAKQGQQPQPVAVQGMTFTPIAVPANGGNQNPPPSANNGKNNPPAIIIKGQTLTQNGPPATINGKAIVYSAGAVYAAGTRVAVPTLQPGQAATPINVAGLVITPAPAPPSRQDTGGDAPAPAAVIVAGHTIVADSPAITINGNTLAYSHGSVYVNGVAAPAPTLPPSQQKQTANSPLVVGGLTVSPTPQSATPITTIAGHTIAFSPSSNGNNAIIISDSSGITTVTPFAPAVTIAGTAISLNPSALVIGTSTIPLTAESIATDAFGHTFTLSPPSVTASNGQDAASVVVIAPGQTVTAGGKAITVSGVVYSMVESAGQEFLVENGSVTLPFLSTSASASTSVVGTATRTAVSGQGSGNSTAMMTSSAGAATSIVPFVPGGSGGGSGGGGNGGAESAGASMRWRSSLGFAVVAAVWGLMVLDL